MKIQLVDPEHNHKLQDPLIQIEHDHNLQYHIMTVEAGKKAWLKLGETLRKAEERQKQLEREVGGL